MEVKRASKRHLKALALLFDAYRQFYGQESDQKGALRFLRKRLGAKDSVIFLAFDDSGAPCGFVQLYPSLSSVSMKRLWILNDLFVLSAARRNGIAQSLIKRSVRHAKDTTSKALVLETAIDNQPAQALYEKLGWKKDNDFHRYFFNLEPE